MRLVRVAAAVRAEDTARGRAEANEERDHCAENEPQRVTVVGGEAVLAVLVLRDAEEHHGDHPCNDGGQHSERGEERHENGACAMVSRAADTKQERKTGKTWANGSDSEQVNRLVFSPAAIGTRMRASVKLWMMLSLRREELCASQLLNYGIDKDRHVLDTLEVIANHGLRSGETEGSVVNTVRPEVVDGVPCRRRDRREDEEHHRGEGEEETWDSSSGGHCVLWFVGGLLQGAVSEELWH